MATLGKMTVTDAVPVIAESAVFHFVAVVAPDFVPLIGLILYFGIQASDQFVVQYRSVEDAVHLAACFLFAVTMKAEVCVATESIPAVPHSAV